MFPADKTIGFVAFDKRIIMERWTGPTNVCQFDRINASPARTLYKNIIILRNFLKLLS